ncbi:MAG TPA: PLP-dependent aminotransferase family protein [Gaiellaceae bacterium]|nr:PLP-dependent aminotransferase family protein [Gaiellaceae bacterium]
MISFARGIPSPDLLPIEELAECAQVALARDGDVALNYGPAGGYAPLREWIAERHGVPATRVVITNGSLQGLALVAEHVARAGGKAIVEAPTYDRTLAALRRLEIAVDAIPLDENGLDLDALAEALPDDGPALVYTIPTYQNPTGRTLPLDDRRRLAELARERKIILYEDDPYRLVRFEGDSPPTLHELAGGEEVVFATSFSKTVAPGLRLGYLVVPEALVGRLEELVLATYIAPSGASQAALAEFVHRGRFEANLERVSSELRARRDAMLNALEREMPAEASWSEPEGGYFLWVDLPEPVDAAALLERAAAAGVTFVPGREFYVGRGGEHALRLAYSFASVAEIEEGVERLARLVREASANEALTGLPGSSTQARS